MTYPVPAVNNRQANYNAVKIQINDPKTKISPNNKPNPDDNGIYNGVDIQINRPSVEPFTRPIYQYPMYEEGPVPYCMAVPGAKLPLAYQTNLISNRTFVHNNNAYEIEFEFDELKSKENKINKTDVEKAAEPEKNQEESNEILIIEKVEEPQVPEANYTTLEAEKAEAPIVNGLNFRAKKEPEIIPSQEILPEADIPAIIDNLSNPNYDIQAEQMEEIVRTAMTTPDKALPYVVRDIFSSLIEIVQKDTTKLAAPNQAQAETRRQIIVNEVIKEYAKTNNLNTENVELPYKLTEEEIASAVKLTPMELAERNKEYALYAMAALAKVYTDEIEKESGTVIPLTDLPGISTVVDTLRYNINPETKIAAIDALLYIQRPEYKEELVSLFNLVSKDRSNEVAAVAAEALAFLNNSEK